MDDLLTSYVAFYSDEREAEQLNALWSQTVRYLNFLYNIYYIASISINHTIITIDPFDEISYALGQTSKKVGFLDPRS